MKKAISLLLASLMMVCIFAGCSSNGDTGSGSSSDSSVSDSSSSDSSSSESSSSESSSSESGAANTDYMSWNSEDWNSASDEEKEACTLAYPMYIADLMGQGDTVTEEMMKPQVENMISAVDVLFKAMPSTGFETLQEAAKAGYEALQGNNAE